MQNAVYRPTDTEVAFLQQIMQLPGFEVLKKVLIGIVDEFQIDLMNTDPSDDNYDKLVRNRHNLALAAGMVYQKLENKLDGYLNVAREKGQPAVLPDPTSDLFDE